MPLRVGSDAFAERVDTGLEDAFMRGAVRSAQERLRERKHTSSEQLGDWEAWRDHGEEIRTHTLNHLDYYLEQLSDNIAEMGGHVFFAETAEEANAYVREVARKKEAKKIVKSKSMVTEEISLNEVLEADGREVIETDLGEYILQIDDHDPPSHIVAPALHKNRSQIRDVFKERKGYSETDDPDELTRFAREQLRQEFLDADLGITGCNFAVAESGSISLVTNEGNARLVSALPKTQVTVMGMERIVPTWEELDVLVSLLCRSAVGQKLTSYITGLTGPKTEGEVDGPEEFHLVIVDNGRSKILGTQFQSALHCIRCAACVNVCPVYRHVGGHAYGSIYNGPIGAVLTPLLDGYENNKDLPYASSLCAACTEACPVKIPLHEHLIAHRQIITEKEKLGSMPERWSMRLFGTGVSSSKLYRLASKNAHLALKPWTKGDRISSGPSLIKEWTRSRDLPAPSRDRFRDWWMRRGKGDGQDE
ncbi:predicted L-lactate dehydrogenase, iron-sulfur cluster-binding subunit YkgF [Geomicrobium sp. JCM 19037]|uniref:LutB/LldF family L-lactate oxidation iron-sulfur protein n=1 Tax=Geomicrobium sp. JCM 19037 TaxID=1460634 RepID=UPI00045F160D|nr:LutB/LldF family L-lactate oxidation iron-sulfur protein [Geomicrobium sp. JCM 19037]GAK02528.1 predicted L-lactate dehydrogenase, iron-sulfur cluster-binding subunit YkgF [Geomicrobium sp. JCM 19037]